MATRQHKWTETDIRFLQDNYGRIPPADIAVALGVTVSAVISMAHAKGIKAPQKKCGKPEADIVRLKNEGMTTQEVATSLGLTKGQVERVLYRKSSDWQPNHRVVWDKQKMDHLLRMVKAGKPARVIADELGITINALRIKAKKMGLSFRYGLKSYGQDDVDLAYQMKAAGMTNAQIAEKLDDPPISVNTVNRILVNESPSWEIV